MSKTQTQLIATHLKEQGPINTDEARIMYSIVDVPKVVSELGKVLKIIHRPINRANPATRKIRGIVEYRLDRSNAE